MARVLVYYPFKLNAWYAKAFALTLNSQKHTIDYVTENWATHEKERAFHNVVFVPENKLYIIGHCGAGEDKLYSEPSPNGKDESITYSALADNIDSYTGSTPPLATIKIAACDSAAAPFAAAPVKAASDFFGVPVPKGFLSFAQKFWDELYYEHDFKNCTCQAYTRVIQWSQNTVKNKDGSVSGSSGVRAPSRTHRWFIDEDGVEKRSKQCRINIVPS
jgi:hypothetical protein